jgi:hypothetical protein
MIKGQRRGVSHKHLMSGTTGHGVVSVTQIVNYHIFSYLDNTAF